MADSDDTIIRYLVYYSEYTGGYEPRVEVHSPGSAGPKPWHGWQHARYEFESEEQAETEWIEHIRPSIEADPHNVGIQWLGPDGFETWKTQREREKYEAKAKEIMERHGVYRLDSMAMLEALDAEIEGEERRQRQLAEDRECTGWGISHRQYQEEMSYAKRKAAGAREIKEWMARRYPVLVANYRNERPDDA